MAVRVVTRAGRYTFEDFCFLVKNGQKADLIDGVIYMASPDNTDANDLFVWMITLMHLFVEHGDLGKVFGCRVAFRLDERNSPEPDIGFIKKHRLQKVKRGHVAGAPDVAFEIVSPESIDRDYVKKRAQFETAQVPEYWIIDEVEEKVTLLRLDGRGKYREIRPRNGELHSQVLTGFWLRLEWLWQTPRPKTMDVLDRILSRQH